MSDNFGHYMAISISVISIFAPRAKATEDLVLVLQEAEFHQPGSYYLHADREIECKSIEPECSFSFR